MLDIAGIMVSSMMMLTIIVRSVRLDRLEPWFQAIERKTLAGGMIRTRRRRS